MKTTQIGRSATLRGRRGIVLLVAGALALGISVTGVHASLAGGSSSLRARVDPTAPSTPMGALAVLTHHLAPVTPAPPAPDPATLADGVYPTYVRAVDVEGATVTVDVLQTFFGDAAHQAAIEDGVRWSDVQYDPVYIRNENPLLRTLPVAQDVHIKLIGVCEAPSRWIGLTQLRSATTPFTDTFYYDVTVLQGSVVGIQQKIAVAGC